MDKEQIQKILERVKTGKMPVSKALDLLKKLPFKDLGFAKIDSHRSLRKGFPEVVFCEGKNDKDACAILAKLASVEPNVLGTRASVSLFKKVKKQCPQAQYHDKARCITISKKRLKPSLGKVVIMTAGTSDIPVAEEARVTAHIMGCKIEPLYDVGVSGLHRLISHLDVLNAADVIIVIAGMEGALPSILGGLTDKPVIAVPTSIGYGAHFGGITPLLSMLNSCASGLTVVNIDNGFGAGYAAATICRLVTEKVKAIRKTA